MAEVLEIPDWPLFGWSDDVRAALAEASREGCSAALATLFSASGGAPRPLGSQMLIGDGRLSGFLSGGCIEGDIAARAANVISDAEPLRLIYGEGGPYPDIRLVCGGRVEILLERIAPDDEAVATLLALTEARRRALWLSDGVHRACMDEARPFSTGMARLDRAGERLARNTGARCSSLDDGAVVALRFEPVSRMIVVGGDPTAMAIASLSARTGMETWLVRPKGPSAPPPLADVRYDRRSPEEAFADIGLDPWTHVAVATHDLETDEAALLAALDSPAAYVGVLGARRRLPERLSRLESRGVSPAGLARLKAPIGLDLGGKAPFEIAVAVLAQVIEARHRSARADAPGTDQGGRAGLPDPAPA